MITLYIHFLFYSVIFFNLRVYAENIEDLKQKYAEMIMVCAKDHPITSADITQLKNKQIPDNDNARCLFACAYKTSGMAHCSLYDFGKVDVNSCNYSLRQFFNNDDGLTIPIKLHGKHMFGMDNQGYLSVDGVNKLAQMYLSDDPERLKKAEQFTDACKSVNDVNVSDGDKGCERAALIFKCSVEKAPQFDFII